MSLGLPAASVGRARRRKARGGYAPWVADAGAEKCILRDKPPNPPTRTFPSYLLLNTNTPLHTTPLTTKMAALSKLPSELILEVAERLQVCDLAAFMQTCRRIHQLEYLPNMLRRKAIDTDPLTRQRYLDRATKKGHPALSWMLDLYRQLARPYDYELRRQSPAHREQCVLQPALTNCRIAATLWTHHRASAARIVDPAPRPWPCC